MPRRSASIPPLVYVRMAAATRRVPGLRVAAPRDGQVQVYARGRLLTLPAARVSRARKPTSAPVVYGRLLAEYERVRRLMAGLGPRPVRGRAL
jgi:hypothetical protein